MDRVDKLTRSKIMSKVRSKNTSIEMLVRSITYSMGYRYKLHCKNLPGTPDLVFTKKNKVIQVNGCFWHYHACNKCKIPKSNEEFWLEKLTRNKERDKKVQESLQTIGWSVLTIWECEIKNTETLKERIQAFLGPKNSKKPKTQ